MLDLSNRSFGKLKVLQVSENHKKGSGKGVLWQCLCECGELCEFNSTTLKSAKYTKLACDKCLVGALINITESSSYTSWASMVDRCTNPRNSAYNSYGGRGITVDERWLEERPKGFLNFLEDMGECPEELSLDRIDVNGHYCKENCRWADNKTQMINRTLFNSSKTGVKYVTLSENWYRYYSVNIGEYRRNFPIKNDNEQEALKDAIAYRDEIISRMGLETCLDGAKNLNFIDNFPKVEGISFWILY